MDVYDLLNRDERLEMKLQALSNSTIVPKEYYEPMKFPKNQSIAPLYPSPEDLDMRDLGIEAQLQKISRNSIKEVAGWKPSKIMSAVTEEMIKDYQDELHNTHYEDPITGKKFRYVPAGADIDLETPYLLETYTDEELKGFQAEKILAAQQILDVNEALESLYNYRKRLMDFEIVKPSPYDKGSYKTNYAEYLSQMGERERELENLNVNEHRLKNEILNAEYHIEKYDDAIKRNNEMISDNQAEQSRTDKINRGVLQAKSDELMTLNRGKMNVTQGVNEPAEDYKQRLLDIGAETYDLATITDSARLRNVDRFKTSMKELFRDTVLIDSLVKEIMSKNDDSIFNYNKFMIPLKKNFLEVYGYANKDLKTESIPDIIDFFDNVINKVGLTELTKPKPAEIVLKPKVSYRSASSKPFITEVSSSPTTVYGATFPSVKKVIKAKASEPIDEPIEVPEEEKRIDIITGILPSISPVATQALYMSPNHLRDSYQDEYFALTKKPLKEQRAAILRQLDDSGIVDVQRQLRDYTNAQSRTKSLENYLPLKGKGISDRKLPKRMNFGKIALNPHRLYYDNILVVLRQDGGHLLGYKNIPVSDAFVNVLMKIMDAEPVHHQDFKMFSINERELYDNLIHLAGLHKKVENNIDSTRKGMKQRLELIEGEIGAGNTNVNLKHEVKQLLHKMAYGGMISHPQARSHLKQLTSHF
jgi:hypothetical protein